MSVPQAAPEWNERVVCVSLWPEKNRLQERKMNRIVLALILALAVLFGGLLVVVSCGDDDDDDSGGGDDDGGDDNAEDDDDDDNDDGGGDDDDDNDDTSNKTWTDPSSGLTWQVTPYGDYMDWEDAMVYCQNLSLDGGGWYLPTISELRTLIRGCDSTVTGGSCGVTDECASYDCWSEDCWDKVDCEYEGGPNNGCYWPIELLGYCYHFYSSSTVEEFAGVVWEVDFNTGGVVTTDDVGTKFSRCVR